MVFWLSIPQKGASIVHLGTNDDPTIRISKHFDKKEAVKVIEAIEAVEATEVIEAAEVLRPGKSLLRTSESSSPGIWIQLYFYVLRKKFSG